MISVPTVSLFPECRGVFLRQVKSSSVSTLPHRNLNETRRRLHGHRARAVAPPASLIQLCVISPPLWSGLLGLLLGRGCLGALAPVIPASSDASFPALSSLSPPTSPHCSSPLSSVRAQHDAAERPRFLTYLCTADLPSLKPGGSRGQGVRRSY